MPIYEYRCEECGTTFDRTEHVKEHESVEPKCPRCGSGKIVHVLTPFFPKTSKKS